MKLNNYHTHTYRCSHAEGSDEQFVQAAIDAKLKLIGFSDHMPLPNNFESNDRMKFSEVDEYLQSIARLKYKYKDKIEVLSGFECEWLKHQKDFLIDLRARCDYMILGHHIRVLPESIYDYTYYASDEDIICYGEEIIEALESGLFSYLCHPEYPMLGRSTFSETCSLVYHQICQTCRRLDIPVELNIKGYEKKYIIDGISQPAYPLRKFWEIAAKSKVKVIYGLDAHRPRDLFRFHLVEEVKQHLIGIDLHIIEKISL